MRLCLPTKSGVRIGIIALHSRVSLGLLQGTPDFLRHKHEENDDAKASNSQASELYSTR